MTTMTPLEQACYAYLSEQKTTLWGDWDITDPGRRRLAARWLADQVQSVVGHMHQPTLF